VYKNEKKTRDQKYSKKKKINLKNPILDSKNPESGFLEQIMGFSSPK